MLKYISETIDRLMGLKNGLEKNSAVWQNQGITPQIIQARLDELQAISKEVDELKEQVSVKLALARTVQVSSEKFADNTENIAIGLENGDPDKLSAYGIKLRKAPSKRSAPSTPIHPSIQDDTDGEGFIVSTTYQADADIYEWEKGFAADPTKTDIVPEMKFFKATKKTSFVDDDVIKGVRYFYRVRATNNAGVGAWSEAVSRVQ